MQSGARDGRLGPEILADAVHLVRRDAPAAMRLVADFDAATDGVGDSAAGRTSGLAAGIVAVK